MKEHTLYIEKYRPKILSEYVGNDDLKTNIQKYLDKNDIPHLVFYGPAGTGKTSMAKLIVRNLNCDHIYLNASDENGIETIREKVKNFASSASFKPLKVVLLDEADKLTGAAQDALRFIMEEYSINTRFILTANNFSRITEPLKSRCEDYKVITLSKSEIMQHLIKILDLEKISYKNEDLVPLIKAVYPDMRAMLKTLQKCINDKKELIIKEVSQSFYGEIIGKLITKTPKAWYEIRQIIANNQDDNYQLLYQFLFENLDKFAKGNEAQATIIIDEYLWRSFAVNDKEINIMAMFGRLLENLK